MTDEQEAEDARVAKRADMFKAMAERIERNSDAKFGGAFDPEAAGIIRQSRSDKGAAGPFVFLSSRYTEIVMPVKTGEEEPAASFRSVDPETGEITEGKRQP